MAAEFEILYDHLVRMGEKGVVDDVGFEYVTGYSSFWYPMIRIAEQRGTLAVVLNGIDAVYQYGPHGGVTLSWDDIANKSLRYYCYMKVLK